MAHLVNFLDIDGEEVWLKADHVSALQSDGADTKVWVVGCSEPFAIKRMASDLAISLKSQDGSA